MGSPIFNPCWPFHRYRTIRLVLFPCSEGHYSFIDASVALHIQEWSALRPPAPHLGLQCQNFPFSVGLAALVSHGLQAKMCRWKTSTFLWTSFYCHKRIEPLKLEQQALVFRSDTHLMGRRKENNKSIPAARGAHKLTVVNPSWSTPH